MSASESATTATAKERDRIKTLDQFKTELEVLMETKLNHEQKLKECKELAAKLKVVKQRVLPFMEDNLKQKRVNCSKYKMYISTSVVKRNRKVRVEHIYEIIEQTLGAENRALIKQKAKELAQQKIEMKTVRIASISTKRADKRKDRAEELKQAALAGEPAPKRTRKAAIK
jgi:hypothetical protein